ncbi:hypothetical protein RZS08_23655 [Arthrospira platensis SPKY1]|nr:hypothetical protein [Arthrospira platensis SPKY1]
MSTRRTVQTTPHGLYCKRYERVLGRSEADDPPPTQLKGAVK